MAENPGKHRGLPAVAAPVRKVAVSFLQFLGTGPGSPVRGRYFSSCLMVHDTSMVLIDAGEPCSQRLAEFGISSADIDAVLLTHGHSDHTAGLPMLLQSAWLAPRLKALSVYLPGELIEPLQSWLQAVYLPPSLLGFELSFHAWAAGRAVSAAREIDATPFPTTHLEGLRRLIDPAARDKFEIFGLDILCGGKRVVFSSDLGSPGDLEGVLRDPCEVLVCELSHFGPHELLAFLRNKKVGTLVLNHLAPELSNDGAKVSKDAARALPHVGRVVVPVDGEKIEF